MDDQTYNDFLCLEADDTIGRFLKDFHRRDASATHSPSTSFIDPPLPTPNHLPGKKQEFSLKNIMTNNNNENDDENDKKSVHLSVRLAVAKGGLLWSVGPRPFVCPSLSE